MTPSPFLSYYSRELCVFLLKDFRVRFFSGLCFVTLRFSSSSFDESFLVSVLRRSGFLIFGVFEFGSSKVRRHVHFLSFSGVDISSYLCLFFPVSSFSINIKFVNFNTDYLVTLLIYMQKEKDIISWDFFASHYSGFFNNFLNTCIRDYQKFLEFSFVNSVGSHSFFIGFCYHCSNSIFSSFRLLIASDLSKKQSRNSGGLLFIRDFFRLNSNYRALI